jgi:UDP-GlcNAc:undecaprenyl-phosphate GlcNAc-1-phosphate transferase
MLVGLAVAAASAWTAGVEPPWLTIAAVVFGGFFIAAYINVANFMDGIDGISSLHGVVVGGSFVVIGGVWAADWMMVTGAVLVASFLGFLPWNVLRKRTFLGDSGSYLLGGGVAGTAVAAVISGIPPLAALSPLALYVGDTGITLLRRVRAGEVWHEPHRSHVYQRLSAAPSRRSPHHRPRSASQDRLRGEHSPSLRRSRSP